MKRKAVRITLLVAMLGVLAAIPAATQGFLPASPTSGDDASVDLRMVLLVNRLELSRAQMEALRSATSGLAEKKSAIEEKESAFEQEMIAFTGTPVELDSRLAAFDEEMAAAQAALQQEVDAALAILKDTLTMKQGEILSAAFPGILTVSFESNCMPANRIRLVIGSERAAARAGRRGLVITSESENPNDVIARPCGLGRLDQAMGRVAQKLANAGIALAERLCPMMGDPASQTGSAGERRAELSGDAGADAKVLGKTESPASLVRPLAGISDRALRLASWLEQFAQVLELKLAAMT